MQLIDTHCHIHEAAHAADPHNPTHALWLKAGDADPDGILRRAQKSHITKIICVGTTVKDSQQAIKFAQTHPNCYAAIGIHPHEAQAEKVSDLADLLDSQNSHARSPQDLPTIQKSVRFSPGRRGRLGLHYAGPTFLDSGQVLGGARPKNVIVAIGECGLDYYYNHSPKKAQQKALHAQIQLALKHNLPLTFHVREAYNDFWPILDTYQGVRGVLHSYTDNLANYQKAMQRGLYIGVNGIITFTKSPEHIQIIKEVPLQKLLLETDAPFLTPVPHRGKVNEPAHVGLVAEFVAKLKDKPLSEIAAQTTANAQTLFNLKN